MSLWEIKFYLGIRLLFILYPKLLTYILLIFIVLIRSDVSLLSNLYDGWCLPYETAIIDQGMNLSLYTDRTNQFRHPTLKLISNKHA